MINVFVAVGTHEVGFPRLCKVIANVDPSVFNVVVQEGATKNIKYPKEFEVVDFITASQMSEYAAWSDFLISQTSPGLIQLAWANSSVSVSCPRSKRLGEAVDNHQVEFGTFLMQQGSTIIIDEKINLQDLLFSTINKAASIVENQLKTLELFEYRKASIADQIRLRIENH